MTADTPARKRYSPGHPDFGKPGNTLATTHGAWSARRRNPIAEAIHEARMADPATPAVLREDPSYFPELWDLATVEAMCELMDQWICENGLAEALADISTETETASQEGPSRKTTRRARRVVAVAEQRRRYVALASKMRAGMGLTALSRHQLEMDHGPKYDSAQIVAALLAEDAKREDSGGE